ncbi:hypothetical protein [Foetidibacter luteolus]|uniref:hypothetical protein n=1 Tax=Foetidibacter luteolus TaxID=2608880 RepID=UPI00129BEEA2|nr:hypothetical protein [Foetidibacter luteolus]
MKKHLLWLSVMFALVIAASYQQQVGELINPEKPVTKDISLAVYAGSNYNSKIYDESVAKLHVTVYKVRGKKESIVWQKSFDAMELKELPDCSNALSQEVRISNVFDKKEQLIVTYTLVYESKGSIVERYNGSLVGKGKNAEKLYINI